MRSGEWEGKKQEEAWALGQPGGRQDRESGPCKGCGRGPRFGGRYEDPACRAGSLGTLALWSVPGEEGSREARKQPRLLTLRISPAPKPPHMPQQQEVSNQLSKPTGGYTPRAKDRLRKCGQADWQTGSPPASSHQT